MREFVNKGAELLGWFLAGKDGDAAAVAHAQGGGDGFLELKLDTLGDGEVDQPFAELANLSPGALGECGKLGPFGLRHVEHVDGAESDQYGLVLLGEVLVGLGVLLLAGADHRGKDADALLSLHHLASKLVPRIQACDAGCVGLLPCDFEDVPEAVVMETAHGGEVGGEAFAVSGLKLLDKQLHVGGDDFFRGLRLGCGGKGGDVAGGGGCVLGGVAAVSW